MSAKPAVPPRRAGRENVPRAMAGTLSSRRQTPVRPGLRRNTAKQGPRRKARNTQRLYPGSAALLERHLRARPRHGRRRRAWLDHSHRRRTGHRQIDFAASGRSCIWRGAAAERSISPARKRLLRCGCALPGSDCRTLSRPRVGNQSCRIFSRRSATTVRRISSSSIRFRRSGPIRSMRRPGPSARCGRRHKRSSAMRRSRAPCYYWSGT